MRASVAMQRRPARRKRLNVSVAIGDVLTAVVGFTASFLIHLIGDLPVAEGIFLGLLPFLLIVRGRRILSPLTLRVLMLIGLWLMGQILTDIYRQTAMLDWIRGDAGILFLAIDFIGLTILLAGNRRRQVIFFITYAFGSIFDTRFFPSEFSSAYPWKFGYAYGVSLLILLVSCPFYRRRRYGAVLVLLAGLMGIDLLLNYRSATLSIMITIALVVPVIPERVGHLRLLPRSGSAARSMVLVLMALTAGGVADGLVHWVTSAGLLSRTAQQGNEHEAHAQGGLLLGGRPEIFVSSQAVIDSPILGHGSWPKDYKYVELFDEMSTRDGRTPQLPYGTVIPTHSHLMGAWVSAGVLGAICWLGIFWLAVRATVHFSEIETALAPVYAWLLVNFIWAIFFSPMGSTERMVDANIMVIVLEMLKPGQVTVARVIRRRFVRSAFRTA